jgi:hypothetical protein
MVPSRVVSEFVGDGPLSYCRFWPWQTGIIAGLVKDTSGAVMPGVTINESALIEGSAPRLLTGRVNTSSSISCRAAIR